MGSPCKLSLAALSATLLYCLLPTSVVAQCPNSNGGSLSNGDAVYLGSASWVNTVGYGQASFQWSCFALSISYSGFPCRNPSWQLWNCPSKYFSKTAQGCVMIADRNNGSSGINNIGPQQWPFFFLYNDNTLCSFTYQLSTDAGAQFNVNPCMNCLSWAGNKTAYDYCGNWTVAGNVMWCNDLIQFPCLICPPWAAPLGPNALPNPIDPQCPKARRDYIYPGIPYYLGAANWRYPLPFNTTAFQWPSCFTVWMLSHGGYCQDQTAWTLWGCPTQSFGSQYGCEVVTNYTLVGPSGVTQVPASLWPQYFLTNDNTGSWQCPFTFELFYPGSTSFFPTYCAYCLWSMNDPTANATAICGLGQPYECNGYACYCSSGQTQWCNYFCPPWTREDAGFVVDGNNVTRKPEVKMTAEIAKEEGKYSTAKIVLQD